MDSISFGEEAGKLPDSALWHFRLGHLSDNRIKKTHTEFSFVNVDEESICDICHYVRHKKLYTLQILY